MVSYREPSSNSKIESDCATLKKEVILWPDANQQK